MADLTFNTTAGQAIARELMIAYLNTGTAQSPVWSPVGKRVVDSSMEMDWSKEDSQDILGNTFTTMKKPIISQAFDAWDLDGGDSAGVQIWNRAVHDHDAQALCNNDMLIVHFYAGTASAPFAERYSQCAVEVGGIGGEGGGNLAMPSTVTYGGVRTLGTASKDSSTGAITFTAATSSSGG